MTRVSTTVPILAERATRVTKPRSASMLTKQTVFFVNRGGAIMRTHVLPVDAEGEGRGVPGGRGRLRGAPEGPGASARGRRGDRRQSRLHPGIPPVAGTTPPAQVPVRRRLGPDSRDRRDRRS